MKNIFIVIFFTTLVLASACGEGNYLGQEGQDQNYLDSVAIHKAEELAEVSAEILSTQYSLSDFREELFVRMGGRRDSLTDFESLVERPLAYVPYETIIDAIGSLRNGQLGLVRLEQITEQKQRDNAKIVGAVFHKRSLYPAYDKFELRTKKVHERWNLCPEVYKELLESRSGVICTCFAINDSAVVTAAHCPFAMRPGSMRQFRIVFGHWNYAKKSLSIFVHSSDDRQFDNTLL